MDRENRIQDYLDMLALGCSVGKDDVYKVKRKTTDTWRNSKDNELIVHTQVEEIEFS